MCDYSLSDIESRPAKVGDRLQNASFVGTPCRGFSEAANADMAVCLLPGTELSFTSPIRWQAGLFRLKECASVYRVARFRQINPDDPYTHHDALELPDGEIVFLNHLVIGLRAIVLQLPMAKSAARVAEAVA